MIDTFYKQTRTFGCLGKPLSQTSNVVSALNYYCIDRVYGTGIYAVVQKVDLEVRSSKTETFNTNLRFWYNQRIDNYTFI